MTYTYKLARRLAILRDAAMVCCFALLSGCDGELINQTEPHESFTPEEFSVQVARVVLAPGRVVVERGQPIRFSAYGRSAEGDSVGTSVELEAFGGSLTSDGTFSSNTAGTYKIVGKGRGKGNGKSDTSIVVVTPKVVAVAVTPGAVALDGGTQKTFTAVATLEDGTTTSQGIAWRASGGSIDPVTGVYTAGTSGGVYDVVALSSSGEVSDTSAVTITATEPEEPPPPPPAPTLTQVAISPATISLSTGATQQFTASGKMSDGTSVTPTVTFSATGGTINSSGLYTAGGTAGTFQVKVTSGTLTATSTVTLIAPAPPPPTSTSGTLWRHETFSTYSSTEHYFSNPWGWIDDDVPTWFNQQLISLDVNERYNGHPTLRYDWPAGACRQERQISTKYIPPSARELWVEFAHKFATNFNTMETPCGGSAYKMVFFWQSNGTRFDLVNGVNGSHWFANNPQNPPQPDGPEYGDGTGVQNNQTVPLLNAMGRLWDGQWHVYRFRLRMSSCPTCADGVYQVWVDGKLVVDRQNKIIANSTNGAWSDKIESIILGGNANNGPLYATKTWWGELKVYTANPGW